MTTKTTTKLNLSEKDLERFYRFRITDDLLQLHGIRRVNHHEARNEYGIVTSLPDLAGILFPVFGADEQMKAFRVRRDNPEVRKGKPENRYVMSHDRPHLYFERTSRQYLSDRSVPVIVVENYTSALAIAAYCQRTAQRLLIVGTAGCWGWSGTIGVELTEDGERVAEKGLCAGFAHILFEGRMVFILFDSDVATNPKVRAARRELTKELQELGANVRWPVLPQHDTKLGPDDYIGIASDYDFSTLLNTASTPPAYQSPFRLHENGVWRRVEKENKETGEKETSWRWVCSYLDMSAQFRDGSSGNWGLLLEFKDPDENLHTWLMPTSMLAGNGNCYREQLYSMGLKVAPGRFGSQQLEAYIWSGLPEPRVRCVPRVGWLRTSVDAVYVLPNRTFGTANSEHVLLQSTSTVEHFFKVWGTLEDWQNHVGKYAEGNSRLAFAISLAFAPVLMEWTGETGGGFHYVGSSSTGKTTALLAAGSVWGGGGKDGFLRSWRTTSNGLEAVAEGHCDALLCLDELAQIDAAEAGEIAYMLANGSGKSRAHRDGSSRNAAQWRLIFLSSGELSFADKIEESGKRVRAGHEVRFVDLPADAGAGLGVFENLYEAETADLFSRKLRDNALTYYGTPIRHFMDKFIGRTSEFVDAFMEARKEFMVKYVPAGASGQVQRVAGRFALVAAAGTIATLMETLPWSVNAAEKAVGRCFTDWLARRGTVGESEIVAGVRQVRAFFQMHGDSRFQPCDSSKIVTINRAGFRKRIKTPNGDAVEFFVFPDIFRSEICRGVDPDSVIRELIRLKHLIPSKNRSTSVQRLPGIPKPSRMYHFASSILEGRDD